MLAGMQDPGDSMFSRLTEGMGMQPDAEDMKRAEEAARFNRTVTFERVQVKTFDLGNTKEAGEYIEVLDALFRGMQTQTHVILHKDRKFVEQPKPRWIAHLEWAEFELKEEPVAPVGSEEE